MGVYEELFPSRSRAAQQIPGVVLGIVKENWDSGHPGKIRVEYFLGEEGKNLTGWVPAAAPYAGNGYGAYALPEVGDEVVLAFLMGDRNCPIVLGSVWNRKNVLPEKTAAEQNPVKKLRTKGGCEICFSEEEGKEQILIRTPKELRIVVEDEKETIRISDKDEKNGLQIDGKNGTLTLLADKKLELSVGGKSMVSLDANGGAVKLAAGKITANADQSLELKGQSMKLEGGTAQIKGSGTLKLEAGGTAQLKGAMVQIN